MTIMTDKAMPAMPGLPAAQAAACKRVGWCVKPSIVRFGLCLFCWAVPIVASAKEPAVGLPQEGEVAFESKVRPLLVAKCQSCHGEKLAEAGLRLDSRRSVLIGGESGAVVVPGDAAQGKLLDAVRHVGLLAMPPDDALSADDIATLEKWIAAGLPWSGPGGDAPVDAGPATHTPDHPADMKQRLATSLATHWAFTPPLRHVAPAVPLWPLHASPTTGSGADWNTSPIDRFIAERIIAAGLEPSPEASPRELVRRLWFDLTGLPPPADQADVFCEAPSHEAFCGLTDRLLATPEHAEHWARKWLDLARYADTMGYAFDNQDSRYPFAWTYRDWVVGALSRDLPYNQFITLQIAADCIQPAVPREDLAALGFLTVGRTFLGNQHDIIDDRIDLVTRGLMGLTVACARCHDHKYEPVSTADYYAVHGIFASSRIPEELPIVADATGPGVAEFATQFAALKAAVSEHEAAVHARAIREAVAHAADYFVETARPTPRNSDNRLPRLADGYELEQLLIDRLLRMLQKPDASHPILGPWVAVRSKPDAAVAAGIRDLVASRQHEIHPLVLHELRSSMPTTLRALAEVYARLVMRVAPEVAGGQALQTDDSAELVSLRTLLGAEGTPLVVPADDAMRVAKRDEQTELRKRLRAITIHQSESVGGPSRAMALMDAKTPVESHILLRGNPAKVGQQVARRMPMVLGGKPVDPESSGRLDLARAIVAPENPLTARVIVNWVWMHHVGRGLIGTPGDLGLRGEAPSHPELLDDLTRRFVEDGQWSLRWLHREIVTSCLWRQSSTVREDVAIRDPDNHLFARANRRRLDWEAWRDSLLCAAGSLDASKRGGRSVNPLATESMDARSIYGRLDRQDVPGILRVFDIASPDTAVHVRTRTTVPQQSLAILNAPLVVEAARQIAARVNREVGDSQPNPDQARVDCLWRAVLSRSPSADERAQAGQWLAAEAALSPVVDSAVDSAASVQVGGFGRWERLAQALVATAEFQCVD